MAHREKEQRRYQENPLKDMSSGGQLLGFTWVSLGFKQSAQLHWVPVQQFKAPVSIEFAGPSVEMILNVSFLALFLFYSSGCKYTELCCDSS